MKTANIPEKTSLTLTLTLLLVVFSTSLIFFWGGISNLFFRWSFQPEYSHGFLIPLVSAYILWDSKDEWSLSFGNGSYWGLPICGTAFLIALAGEISALYLLIHYAFILFLFGFAVCFLGKAVNKVWVPFGLLFFAVPLPYFIEVILTAKLQLLSSSIGVSLIRLFGIPVHLSGNVIDMGAMQLHVVEACSGLRYLFPLASMGVVTSYFYHAHRWKKLIVVLSTVPITLLLNSVRIGLTGIIVDVYGVSHAQGFLHDFEGWIMFVICLSVLAGEIFLIERFTTKRTLLEAFAPQKGERIERDGGVKKNTIAPPLGLLFLCVLSIGLLKHIDARKEVVPQAVSFASFPMQLGEWHGVRQNIHQDVSDALSYSDALMADYIHQEDIESGINFYMAYYESQRKGISPHSPKVCIPGGGWEISEFERIALNEMPVNRVIIRKGQQAQLVYYWFVERGEVVANEYKKKWWLFRDSITSGRSDGALIRVVAPISQKSNVSDVDKKINAFIARVHPRVLSYLPRKEEGKPL